MSDPAKDGHERRTCITVDLENYSKLEGEAQETAQDGLAQALETAAAEAGLQRLDWDRQESGDRELAVLPSEEDIPRAVGAFPLALDDQFRALHQRTGVLLRGRMAINQGMVKPGPMGFSGWGPCDVTRISDAPAVYRALRDIPGAYLVLALSAELYRDYVQQGHAAVKAEQFRKVPVPKIDATAWVMIPRIDPSKIPVAATDDEPAEQPATTRQQVDATHSPVVQSGRDSSVTNNATNNTVSGSNNTLTKNDFHAPVRTDTMHFGPRHG